jgi:RNA polymerase sigma factor (sigma-70 family)
VVAAARVCDEAAFALLVERHCRELRVHCYRMVGSVDEAEDLVQETFLRAWRHVGGFEGRSTLRAWLYRIATNACPDALDGRARRMLPQDLQPATTGPGAGSAEMVARTDIPWLQPLPDRPWEPPKHATEREPGTKWNRVDGSSTSSVRWVTTNNGPSNGLGDVSVDRRRDARNDADPGPLRCVAHRCGPIAWRSVIAVGRRTSIGTHTG